MATFLRTAILTLLGLTSLWAHAISVSTSEGKLSQRDLFLTIRIPNYEAEHLGRNGGGTAADAVARAFQFSGARLLGQSCTGGNGEVVCLLNFLFSSAPGEKLEAEVHLARETVPNHVHILRIRRDAADGSSIERQTIFDRTFEKEVIDFHEPSALETWAKGARLGAGQLLYQPLLLAMLFTVALLGRPWIYVPVAALAFLTVLPDKFYATPAFFELASAIGLAYFAAEGYYFPQAKGRWMPLALLGAVEGAALAVLARPTASAAVSYGFGNLLAQGLVLALAALVAQRIGEVPRRRLLLLLLGLGVLAAGYIFFSRF